MTKVRIVTRLRSPSLEHRIILAVLGVTSKEEQAAFPGGAVVGNLPANAGGHGFDPWSGKLPHATEQLRPCATTTECVL